MALRAVGYFATQQGDRRPDVRTQIDSFWEPARKPRILIYLRAGAVFEPSTMMGRCLLCPDPIGTRDLTDGVWLWPEGLAHYVEKHAVRVPDEMVQHMSALQFRVPRVDIKLLKMAAATTMFEQPRELADAPPRPQTAPTIPQRAAGGRAPSPVAGASASPAAVRRARPGAADLDDATAAVSLERPWTVQIRGVAGSTGVTPFDAPVVIGRDERSADVVVAHGSISRRHCRLIPGAQSVIVQDLDSQNGVVVRGKKVAQAELREGESFAIGPATLTLARVTP